MWSITRSTTTPRPWIPPILSAMIIITILAFELLSGHLVPSTVMEALIASIPWAYPFLCSDRGMIYKLSNGRFYRVETVMAPAPQAALPWIMWTGWCGDRWQARSNVLNRASSSYNRQEKTRERVEHTKDGRPAGSDLVEVLQKGLAKKVREWNWFSFPMTTDFLEVISMCSHWWKYC